MAVMYCCCGCCGCCGFCGVCGVCGVCGACGFCVVDVVEILTDSPRARKYWSALKTKLQQEGSELSHKLGQLKMPAEDGKMRITDVADTEQLFRLIQSIPSPKAEPFKLWQNV